MLNKFAYANNTLGPLSPEFWVAEGLRILRKQLVMMPLISTNYNPAIARAGQLVHVHTRNELTAARKLPGVDVVAQPLVTTEQLVRLDQQPYVHYRVDDVEQAVSMGDVVNDWIEPGFFAIADKIETVFALQGYDFFRNQAGGAEAGTSYNDLVDLNRVVNVLKIPRNERVMVINSLSESELLKEDKLTRMDTVGSGAALLNGVIGGGAGFSVIPSLSMPQTGDDSTKVKVTGAVNHSAGYMAGAGTIVVDGFTGLLDVGSFIKLETDLNSNIFSVHQITAQSATSGDTTGITIVPEVYRKIKDNARIIVYTPGTVTVTKAATYAGLVRVTPASGTVPDQYGGVSFRADGPVYGIMNVTLVSSGVYDLELNRPLDEAITATGVAAFFPPVALNWTFTRDAVTMVNRPLRLPKGATSAAFGQAMGIAVRVVIGYNQLSQEELVTIDTLFGARSLDLNKGALLIR